MKLLISGHDFRFAVEQLQLQLFPDAPMEPVTEPFKGDGAISTLHRGQTWLTATATVRLGDREAHARRRLATKDAEYTRIRRLVQQAYYLAAVQLLAAPPAWGALSGVRPTKLTTRHLLAGGTPASAEKLLEREYFVSEPRRKLCVDTSLATVQAMQQIAPEDISIYIGIPFCPTRCAYCSFVSLGIERFADLLPPYLDALIREIEYTGKLLAVSGKRIRTLYMGGGTPTTLNTPQMSRLLCAIRTNFDLSHLIEYTVEGGRPDTLDLDKLSAIRTLGADRMSINPQTMNDVVLHAIGRSHSTAQTLQAFQAAKAAGFDGINMDLIAGLPEDTVESYLQSLHQVIALEPSNITVHTLALKKGADLYFNRAKLPDSDAVGQMLSRGEQALRQAGYQPYYLYRQKYMSGSFENVGWCKPGYIGYYNIYMMEELHTVLSLGGGGVSKVNLPNGKLTRFSNPKYPKEYIERIDHVLQQKEQIFSLLREE